MAKAVRRAPEAAVNQKAESSATSNATAPAEIRRIGDRQFRRQLHQQGGWWVDTAYNSSMLTINIVRGSEPYRALVADEPELRRIIEQLDGEIVVVWKNRAYHVR